LKDWNSNINEVCWFSNDRFFISIAYNLLAVLWKVAVFAGRGEDESPSVSYQRSWRKGQVWIEIGIGGIIRPIVDYATYP